MLAKFGITASIHVYPSAYRDDETGDLVECKDSYNVDVNTRDGWKKFMDEIHVPGKPPVKIPDTRTNNNRDTIPIDVQDLIYDLSSSIRWKKYGSLLSAGLRRTLKYPLTFPKARRYLEHFESHCSDHPRIQKFQDLVDGDLVWDEVQSVENLDRQPCWDIEVESSHNYVLNGLLSHNSTSLAAQGVITCNCIPWFTTFYVMPLFEMTRRFSSNYVRPFIDNSPVRSLFQGTDTTNSVLQKSFKNNSQMQFSFAYLDADRTRGVSADAISLDEIQDLCYDFIPIIRETMSGSDWGGIERYAGTPKTLDNTIEGLWTDSSQAEWIIKCYACGHWNTPCLTHDLDAMIGPYDPKISEDRPGTICAKCRRPINARNGRWVHAYPDKRWQFAGYHVPQIILPMHYADPEKWSALLSKKEGKGNTPINVFYNEVCGESYDSGSKIITVTDLKAAADLPWERDPNDAAQHLDEYIYRVLAVDWGGGGEEEMSFTSMAVMGILPSGEIHNLYGYRSLTPHDHEYEAQLCLGAVTKFRCHFLAHDYTGAGSLRETFITQAGFPLRNIVPIVYTRAAAGGILNYKPATQIHPRDHYQMDKSRSLLLTCNQIRRRRLRFFKYDYVDSEDPGLLHDFLALVEEKTDSRLGKDIYTITRDPNRKDDYAQAVNMGAIALYHATGKWPDISATARLKLDKSTLDAIHPAEVNQWEY